MRIRRLSGGMATYPPGAGLAQRVMRDYEFVWIIRGHAIWHANGIAHAAPPGTLILSQPGFTESYRWDPDSPTRHAYFHFDLAGPLDKSLPPRRRWPVMRLMPEGDILRPLFDYIVANLSDAAPNPRALEHAALALFAIYLAGPVGGTQTQTAAVPVAVHRAIQFAAESLAKNPATPLHLLDLAHAASLTPKHLCRLFREHAEITPMQAVLTLRLRHAVQLMARTDFKLERIARECGFATSFHFSRRFRDLYGKPPSTVRADLAAGRFFLPERLHWGKALTIEYPR